MRSLDSHTVRAAMIVALVGVVVGAPDADGKRKRHFCKGCIDSTSIQTGAVMTLNIGDGAVTASKIGPGEVGQSSIADGAVTASKIGPGAVGQNSIAAGAVGTDAIGDGAVTSTKLAPPEWQDVNDLYNGWTTYDDSDLNYPKLRYYIDANGVLHLRGFIRVGTFALAFSVPNALAPAKQALAAIATDNGPTTFSMGAGNGGAYIAIVGGATNYSLDGVSWPVGR